MPSNLSSQMFSGLDAAWNTQYLILGSKDIPEPSHSRVFREKFRSVYVVKGV